MLQVMPCCSRPSVCGTLICMCYNVKSTQGLGLRASSNKSQESPSSSSGHTFTPSRHLAAVSLSSLWLPLREVPSVTIPQHISHPSHTVPPRSPLKSDYRPTIWTLCCSSQGTGEKSANPFCPPAPLGERLYVVWWFVVYAVNLHRLCLTNSINQLSEKSIGCIMAHISQWFIFAFLSFFLQTHTHTSDPPPPGLLL